MNISSNPHHHPPRVNNYKMGVQDSFLSPVEFPIDSAEEHRAHVTFQSVKDQQNQLAHQVASFDNTFDDHDPRPGEVTRFRRGCEAGTGNYVDERIDLSFNPRTGAPENLSARGRYTTGLGTIDMKKDVAWDSHGQAFFEDTRRHKDAFGIPVGREKVRGFEYKGGDEPDGLEYQQEREGWLLP